jgi:hypothetical protein
MSVDNHHLYRLKYGSFSRRENGVMRTYDARGKDNVVELSEEEYDLRPAKFERVDDPAAIKYIKALVTGDDEVLKDESLVDNALDQIQVMATSHLKHPDEWLRESWSRISTMSAVSISVELAGISNLPDLDAIEAVENVREGGPRAGVLKSVEKRRAQLVNG